MESKLIKISDGYSLRSGDILKIMQGRCVMEMIVDLVTEHSFRVKDCSGFYIEHFYKEGLRLVTSKLIPVKILGVDISAEVEPFTGWSFIAENNLPAKSKVCKFKKGSNVIIGWINHQNKIFSTKGQFNPFDFKYYKEVC